jgi:hypothetical protein
MKSGSQAFAASIEDIPASSSYTCFAASNFDLWPTRPFAFIGSWRSPDAAKGGSKRHCSSTVAYCLKQITPMSELRRYPEGAALIFGKSRRAEIALCCFVCEALAYRVLRSIKTEKQRGIVASGASDFIDSATATMFDERRSSALGSLLARGDNYERLAAKR